MCQAERSRSLLILNTIGATKWRLTQRWVKPNEKHQRNKKVSGRQSRPETQYNKSNYFSNCL